MRASILFATVATVALVTILSQAAPASPPMGRERSLAGRIDDRPHPLGQVQRALHARAMEAQAYGKAYGKTHEVARGQFVELARQGEDPVWTLLGEFSDLSHNQIPQPDRTVDNVNYWIDDFDRDHYVDMLFSEANGAISMRNYYIEQSSNRYTVHGDVTDWNPVPGLAYTYDDDLGGPAVWQFLIDSASAWYDAQIAAGKTAAEIDAYLSQFDQGDRYDWDGDGNFNEPDGYIDHCMSVHAGEGNEAGGGSLGDAAIWSHSWYAYSNLVGSVGPSPEYLLGGVQIGGSSYWIGNYTIMPENGGVGVFAHEYGHDLGLPDLYSYDSPNNSTGFWTLMSQGSWLSDGTVDLGTKPSHMGAWEKFQLGWLNYEVAFAGSKSEHKLGPAETNTKQAQGLFVVLPPKEVSTVLADPYSGSWYYWSGQGNNLDNAMIRQFDLGAGASLSAWVNYSIELDWDYAYLMASTDGGVTWAALDTSLSTTTDPHGQNPGYGITGDSGGWVELTADLSAYTGPTLIGFGYWTDGYVVFPGFMVDDVTVTGYATDDAETDGLWNLYGFKRTTGSEVSYHFNAYVAEFRQYRGYDMSLSTAYNFPNLADPAQWNWVEHFPYEPGLLISYWDSSFTDNNTGGHPGQGLLLPVDAHPTVDMRPNGTAWQNAVQTRDSTFGLSKTTALTLHWLGATSNLPSLPAVPSFNDTMQYYRPANPFGGVINPNTGTEIRVKSVSAQGTFMQVQVRPVK